MDWSELTSFMIAERRQVVRCWHPAPPGSLFMMPNGVNVEVNEGESAYQISSGEIITDF